MSRERRKKSRIYKGKREGKKRIGKRLVRYLWGPFSLSPSRWECETIDFGSCRVAPFPPRSLKIKSRVYF